MTFSFQPIVPATPAFRSDGTLYSPQFDDVYASAAGTLAETRHVFLQGNGLPERWRNSGRFTIIETGFGAGLNFLATWQAWREAAPGHARLHFVSVEKHPFSRADLAGIHARFPELRALAGQLLALYPPLLPGFHRLHLDQGRVTLTLLFGEAAVMLNHLDAGADAFYLDGFAPARNPQMWSDAVFADIGRLASPGTSVATYTVAGVVRQRLVKAGFEVEKREGFAGKREMLAGGFAGKAAVNESRTDKRAVVIGAGLAGSACAQRLAERGWAVEIIERHAAAAQGASGNPAGLVRPVFSSDWNTHSRFTSAAFLYVLRHHASMAHAGGTLIQGTGGVLQLARDDDHFDRLQRILDQFALPPELVQLMGTQQAAELAGVPVAGPGCWFPEAAWVKPESICRANLGAASAHTRCLYQGDAAALRRAGQEWEVVDASGVVLASAPVVILANAHFARRFSQAAGLPLRPVRGQASFLPEREGMKLRIAVCREGYITPARDGVHCLGASFNEGMLEEGTRVEDHAANLRRLERMLPGFGAGVVPESLDGRVAFRAMSADRLPVLGELPAEPGLFACLALGSRGMTSAALAAEIVASRIDGDPMPVERDLLAALDVGRFGKKDERREARGKRGEG
ncbi:MAG: bifunctional tRNA (5-methylaminomethyl-2-thiouridine)(34)-methyltransferase MnmD/FAD-dependent 5-carboxymethylaminomethyl-2-thiouridine(34) oxidoreductase MnmC [Burkholderiales bacterium]